VIRVLIADDNAVIRGGVRALLEAAAQDIEVVGEAATGREAIDLAERLEPDVVLLDIRMPVMDGVEAAGRLSGRFKVMMLTYSDDEPMVVGAIRAGAHGYLVHGRFDPDELARSVRDLAGGQQVLSPAVAPVVFDALRRAVPSPAQGRDRARALQPRDRRAALHLREDRQEPHPQHLREARGRQPRRGDRAMARNRRWGRGRRRRRGGLRTHARARGTYAGIGPDPPRKMSPRAHSHSAVVDLPFSAQ
jgi:DNA-binding NarL/FixJ family response regulator